MVCDMRGCDRSDQLKIRKDFSNCLLIFVNFGLFFEQLLYIRCEVVKKSLSFEYQAKALISQPLYLSIYPVRFMHHVFFV